MIYSSIDQGLAEKNSEVVVPLGWVLACVYAVLAVMHPFFVVSPHAWLISVGAAISSVLAIVIASRWPRVEDVNKAFLCVGLLASIALANSIGHLAVEPEPFQTGNVMFVFLAMALSFLSRGWFYGLLSAALVLWGLVVVARPVPDVEPWSWYLMFATAVSVVIFENRLRTERRVVQRQMVLRRGGEALQHLATRPELAKGLPDMFSTICEVAAEALLVDRVSIWLSRYDDGWLVCEARYDAESKEVSRGFRLEMARHRDYLETLNENRLIVVNDSTRDFRMSDLGDAVSRLEAAVISDGRFFGMISFEQRRETRAWEVEEQTLATSFAEMSGAALNAIERVKLEKKVGESQRFERMGILAGGVAHDFNNLLTVILGNADLLSIELEGNEPALRKIGQIQTAGGQAADLARHMLAYSGRGFFVKEATNVGSIVDEIVSGWQRANPEVEFAREYSDVVALVDATQIGQVVLNLLTNAVEAQATRIRVVVDTTTVDEEQLTRFVLSEELNSGRYARLRVIDNGKGMDAATCEQMFDPFYTSKQTGQGLGLAAVLGIVRGHHGSIGVESELGAGTTMEVLLPLAERGVHPNLTRTVQQRNVHEKMKVLVVEDREQIRGMLTDTLSDHEVETNSGIAGLRTTLMQRRSYDVAVVDVTLEDGDGVQGIKLIRHAHPDLPVVVMSGYDGGVAMARIDNRRGIVFLRKPFNAEQLLTSMGQAIERVRARRQPDT